MDPGSPRQLGAGRAGGPGRRAGRGHDAGRAFRDGRRVKDQTALIVATQLTTLRRQVRLLAYGQLALAGLVAYLLWIR